MYHVSFDPFQYFKRFAPVNLIIAKLGREITVITCDRVMVLALYTYSDRPLSMYQVYFIPFYTFKHMLETN